MTLKDLKTYFEANPERIKDNVRINVCSIVLDGKYFVSNCISLLEHHTGNKAYLGYYLRLKEYYDAIKELK